MHTSARQRRRRRVKQAGARPYRGLSLLQLARQMVFKSDEQALHELHQHRPVFHHQAGPPLLLVDYLAAMQEDRRAWEWCGRNAVTLEQAADLTLDKFRNLPLPDGNGHASTASKRPGHSDGPDCRHYFRAFLTHVETRITTEGCTNELAREALAARCLQALVLRHFRLSCLECARRNDRRVRRYRWAVDGRTLSLWMPRDMSGNECRAWLAANVADVDPDRPRERARVQALVDAQLRCAAVVSVDPIKLRHALAVAEHASSAAQEVSVRGLASAVAEEKVAGIEYQRDTIRALGKRRLKRLILTIFEELAVDGESDGTIARSFGLKKATYSRYAGSRWNQRPDGTIPDLWLNTAAVVAAVPEFVEAAQDAGVWAAVERAAADAAQRRTDVNV
jgi:hypothetical protein